MFTSSVNNQTRLITGIIKADMNKLTMQGHQGEEFTVHPATGLWGVTEHFSRCG